MDNWIEKRVNKWLPFYAMIPLVFVFAFNCIVYWTTMALGKEWYHYDFTLSFDRAVPFVPGWIYIYLSCYLFWIVNYVLSAHFGKPRFYRFIAADLTSRVICLALYMFLPTTNIRPELLGSGISMDLMRWLYAADQPVNLFPSIHCLVSWLAYIAVRGQTKIPRWYRCFSCLFALAVIASTQFTKQHYIVDAIAAIAIAEGMWWLSNRFPYYKIAEHAFERINHKIRRWLNGIY